MSKITTLVGVLVTALMGSACAEPSISGAAIGLPDIRIPQSALHFLCRDVESPLGVTPTTNLEKWQQVRAAFGFRDTSGVAVATPMAHRPIAKHDPDPSGANNERHDCQGLIRTVDGTDKYTAFVTLWVSTALERASFEDRTVVAGITLAGDDYGPLHLKRTRNCVILQGTDPNDNGAGWRAWIVNIDATHTCDASHAAGISYVFKKVFKKAHRLNVYRHPAPGQPVAGRWIDTNSQYYIGLQCGPDHFCVIGGDKAGISPVADIGRWNAGSDHQRLAKKSGGALVPSRLRGTITVTPLKSSDTDPDPTFATMTEVASISIQGNDPWAFAQYSTKWGIAVESGSSVSMSLKGTPMGTDTVWHAQYGTSTPQRAYYEPAYHSGKGTVRFRWDPNDEGTWKQCGNGCCGS